MKTTIIALLFTASAHAGPAPAAPTPFSIEDWAGQLRAAAVKGSDKELAKLLDRAALEKKIFVPSRTPDRQALSQARKLYAKGRMTEAIAKYDQVKAGSPEWLEALEEKGWASLRRGDFEKAMAETKTLLSPHLRPVVGSEPFLLQSLAQLKVCDYEAALKTNALFKESQKTRILELQKLADTAKSQAADELIDAVTEFPLTLKETGSKASMLPRQAYRDLEFQKAVFRYKTAQAAIPALGRSRALSVVKALPQLERDLTRARAAAMKRLAKLARIESDENYAVIQKLNLIEVDTIQRVYIDVDNARKQEAAEFAAVGDDELMFIDDGDTWIDELDNFQVRLNACPQDTRRKM